MRLWISPDRDLASSFSLHGNSQQWCPQLSPVGWLPESTSNQWRMNWIEAERTYFCILKWVLHYPFNSRAFLTLFFQRACELNLNGRKCFTSTQAFIHSVFLSSSYYVPVALVGTGEAWLTPFLQDNHYIFAGSSALMYYQDRYIQVNSN